MHHGGDRDGEGGEFRGRKDIVRQGLSFNGVYVLAHTKSSHIPLTTVFSGGPRHGPALIIPWIQCSCKP